MIEIIERILIAAYLSFPIIAIASLIIVWAEKDDYRRRR